MINKIYLHWTAGRYDQFFNDYHICIDGDGVAHKMADFETKLAHTWQRNSNAVGIALCCCYGAKLDKIRVEKNPVTYKSKEMRCSKSEFIEEYIKYRVDWGYYPPTKEQILSMAHCVADICKQYNLPVNKDTVMTHAEVADMDGYGLHDNDPDLRWDLLKLSTTGNVPGGDVIRDMAKVLIREEVVEYGAE